MTNTEIKKELEKFGLSTNQATIYILLVGHKELRIQEIVKLAKIPRSSVYESLRGLFELGIAEEIVDGSFKKIRPYSIGAMKHGIDEQVLQLRRLTSDLDKLEKAIEMSPPNNSSSTVVHYYKGRSGVRQLYWNSLKVAGKDTVYIYSDWGRGRYVGMKFYENFVAESRERNFQEKVLVNLTPALLESVKKYTYPNSPISRTKIENLRVIDKKIVSIKGDTLIYDNIYAQVYLKNVEIHGFEIENSQFTETQKSIFETLWNMAEPIEKFL